MDINALSAASIQGITGNRQTSLATAMIKMDATEQNRMADILAQNTQNLSRNISNTGSNKQFSIYV